MQSTRRPINPAHRLRQVARAAIKSSMSLAADTGPETQTLATLDDTAAAAARIARVARPGDVIAIHGDLGAGKTAFARAFISALMGQPTEVPSPTFTLAQTYETPFGMVWHFDLYRIERAEDAYELGLEEAFAEGISLIEWPERLGELLPPGHLALKLEIASDGATRRLSVMHRAGDWDVRLRGPAAAGVRAEAARAFIAAAGWAQARRQPLAGDASFRRYERLVRADGASAVLMDAAPPKEDVRPFLRVQAILDRFGFSVPQVMARDTELGFLLLEDLGDNLYSRAIPLGADETQLYEAAVDLLAALHRAPPAAGLPAYGETQLVAAPDNVVDWYLPALSGQPTPDAARAAFAALWRDALAQAQGFPQVMVLRDYHADNLIWLPARDGLRRVGLLDFQDAALGHPAYDLVSLLQDARRDVAPELEERLLRRYLAASGFDAAAFRRAYAIVGAARNSRILGLWPRLWKRDGKPQYLRLLPRTWGLLERDLAEPALAPIGDWYARHIPAAVRRMQLPGAPA